MSSLDEIDINILIDLYEIDINNSGEEFLNLAKNYLTETDRKQITQELASHLLKLERFDYIKFDGQPFITGGFMHPKYRNNVIKIYVDQIHVKEKSINLVEEARKTVIEKASDKTKKIISDVGKSLYGEAKDFIVKIIAEMLTKKEPQ